MSLTADERRWTQISTENFLICVYLRSSVVKIFFRRAASVLISISLFQLFLPASASAWNNVGHRAIAELAWMKMDKGERQAVSELLQQHPHYRSMLVSDVPRGVDKNEWAFLCAAVWPDWVRPAKHGHAPKPESVTKYNLYPHAVGFPFLRRGDTNQALIDNFFIARPDAEMVLSNLMVQLKNKAMPAPDRAVTLAWMLHLFGDLHQPLHAANLVTKKNPGGSGLGGNFLVRDEHKKQIDLHSYWDELPGVNPSYSAVAGLARKLNSSRDLNPMALPDYQTNKTVAAWVQESFRLAVTFAYSEDHVQFVPEHDVDSGKIKTSAIPLLRPDYVSGSRQIAYRRLVLAGQRLADELKQDF
jgi:hypothetical protein